MVGMSSGASPQGNGITGTVSISPVLGSLLSTGSTLFLVGGMDGLRTPPGRGRDAGRATVVVGSAPFSGLADLALGAAVGIAAFVLLYADNCSGEASITSPGRSVERPG
jgi:hypothetical protein